MRVQGVAETARCATCTDMLRAALILLALLGYVALLGLTVWLVQRTAPSFIGWLDELLTPDGTRAVPVGVTAILLLVAYFVWLARRDAARPSG